MKTEHYFQITYNHKTEMGRKIIAFIGAIAYFPSLFIKIFLRKNFGERYFDFVSAAALGIALLFPIVIYLAYLIYFPSSPQGAASMMMGQNAPDMGMFQGMGNPQAMPTPPQRNDTGETVFASLNIASYLIGWLFFVVTCYRSYKKKKRSMFAYDFNRFSYYSGEPRIPWKKFKMGGNPFKIEVVNEGGLFLFIGVLIVLIPGLNFLGILFMVTGFCHMVSQYSRYYLGRQAMLDKIDMLILKENLVKVMIESKEPADANGVEFPGGLPRSKEERTKIYRTLFNREDDFVTV